MYHELPEPECKECGAKNSERFYDRYQSGIRCKSCGHEVINTKRCNGFDVSQPTVYTGTGNRQLF